MNCYVQHDEELTVFTVRSTAKIHCLYSGIRNGNIYQGARAVFFNCGLISCEKCCETIKTTIKTSN